MRARSILPMIGAAIFPFSAMAATPFPAGYEAAYQAYARALKVAGETAPWLTQLNGVSSQPAMIRVGGRPMLYLFACRNHACDANNVNLFLAPDRKSFRAVLRTRGAQTLLGGAGAIELACVRKAEAAGGVMESC